MTRTVRYHGTLLRGLFQFSRRWEVTQVVYPDATELVGADGVTPEGTAVGFGSVLEVKIGTGSPCS